MYILMVDTWRDFTPVHMDNAPETLKGIQRKDCLLSLPNYIDTCLIIRFSITFLRRPPIVGVQGKTVLVGHMHTILGKSLNYCTVPPKPFYALQV